MAFRLIKIDDALRGEHCYLTSDDDCYCLGEYHSRAGFSAGEVNNLISNLKKPVTKRALAEYRYKDQSIVKAGQLVRGILSAGAPASCSFIPIPPSKARTDPLYDDRLTRILTSGQPQLDVREVLVMRQSTRSHHEFAEGERRPTPDDLYPLLAIDESCLAAPLLPTVFLFDDVLTNGTHFKACKRLLKERVPTCNVVGLFIGRRKCPPEDIDPASIFGEAL
ncbi:hypothetical protein [Roseateles toxinivorans]|uniref:Phosphoribosyl transferase-like protein n=1 Tax=Roseateles toxinivorans TaxID=270368 RepID=A0A4R6QDA6_9BURK|nr:hypothetical protein [Roseateles toxinivorans]TDP60648.1 hypothetical protein DES47_11570 [Roseateles toxinivorans]